MKATVIDRLVRRSSADLKSRGNGHKRRLDHHTRRMVVAAIKLKNRSLDKLAPEEVMAIFLDSEPTDLNAVETKQLQRYLAAWNIERMV